MAKQFRIKRTYNSIKINPGGSEVLDLPRGYDFESIHLRLNGSVTISAAGSAVRAEAPCQAISRVEIIADGRNTLYSAPFWAAVLGKYDRASMLDQGARATTPPSGFTAATYAFEALGVIDFMTPDGERPKDSNFRTDGLQLFQLRLTFGTASDMFIGATAAYETGANVEITTIETVELPDANGVRTTPVALKKVSFQEFTVPTTTANQEVRLPAGNMIKSVLIRVEGGTTAGEASSGNLNNVQLFSGVDVRCNVRAASIRGSNNNDYGAFTDGYYILDLARNGGLTARLSELWDVTNQAEPKISMDIVGGPNVKGQAVITEYLSIG